ncbi:hypothetical protein [Glutamicibacter protophormiae]|uniref:UPF0716 family protein affecting phage T7 exclusion n=1 Tax=Glutamicibacter protophormiae TaxID=37930 RepID=A0ABS4XS55_GLUPR|nr:hypothetical protein [Glutamicibacter protophormiae]MBP2399340.1 UPF0716 family protein affecting phage T7 exclusion [Glutamicibacter protophormiae]GGL85601.1 hypothetical protein GCM10010038_14450 [Glutamicibacter protophormiae]
MPALLLLFATLKFGQLLFAAGVVLHLTGEYSSKQIGSMPQAMPRHGVLLAAKPLVVVAPGFLGGMLAIALGTAPAALSVQRLGVFTVGDRVTSTLGDGDIWFCWA